MEEFKGNSHKMKSEKRTVKPVATDAKRKKRSSGSKWRDVFIAEDASNVTNYIAMDVLVPAIKKAVFDIVTNGVDMLLYGGSKGGRRNNSDVPYVSYSNGGRRERREDSDRNRRRGYDPDVIVFKTRREAEEVVDSMNDMLDRYGIVSVADFYQLANVSSEYTDNDYGWTSIGNPEIVRERDGGYVIKLRRPTPID